MSLHLIPRIFLVGPMGAGKTTVGRKLARMLGRDFLDSDQEIEQQAGVSIPLIFEMEGEAGFRLREKAAIKELTQRAAIILSTGGGAILDAENRRYLASNGFVVYLETAVEVQLRRTSHDHSRPLLQTANPRARLAQLLRRRDPLYRAVADLVVRSDNLSPLAIAEKIIHHLREEHSCLLREQ